MKTIFQRVVGAAAIGVALAAGGGAPASAAECSAGPTSLATLFGPGYSCTQQDKIWSNFASSTLSGTGTALFQLVILPSLEEEHTLTVLDSFAQNSIYDLSYTISIDPVLAPQFNFSKGTGGILFASPGGTATLEKAFTDQDGAALPGLLADAANPVVTSLFPEGVTSVNVVDTFFTDGSNVTGFANTFTQADVRTPEPASLMLLGAGLLGLGAARRRWQ